MKSWLLLSIVTALFWGVWGAFIEIPSQRGFPPTLGYIAWAFTMIPCALFALYRAGWKVETDIRSVALGMIAGITGAGGQLVLFQALKQGPAYIVFPLISLFPILTVILSVIFLRERASPRQRRGIAFAVVSIPFLSYTQTSGDIVSSYGWLFLAMIVFAAWGLQGFVLKFANNTMQAESIFFYMAVSGLLLTPFAWSITTFARPVNFGADGAVLATAIHLLNSIGALTLVYALRYGKAMIVVPLTGLSPVITVILSLIIYGVIPGPILCIGVVLASIATYLLSE